MKEDRFRLEIREKFFPIKGSEALGQVVQRSCGHPTPEVLKVSLGGALSNLIYTWQGGRKR